MAQITFGWYPNPASEDVMGYKLYYGTDSQTYGTPINVGNVTTFTLNGLTPKVTYYFALTAYNQFGESSYSNEVSAQIITPTAQVTETVSGPTALGGVTSGFTGTSYTYTAAGSNSNLKHSLQYQFDWKGDATVLSPWGSATQSRTWTVAGTYNVRARARCATHTSVVSSWSGSLSVTMSVAAGSLTVTPSNGLVSSGNQGGPFSPSSKTYTLRNTGGSSIKWRASKGRIWTTLSSTRGTLAAGASKTVKVSINSLARSGAVGSYSDTLTFTNTTNENGNTTRPISLHVGKRSAAVDSYSDTATFTNTTNGNGNATRPVSQSVAAVSKPNLIVSILAGPAMAVAPGEAITLSEATKNDGSGATTVNTLTRFYWSTNSTYDASDVQLGQRTVDPLTAGAISGLVSTSVTIPTTAVSGTYYIIAVADATNMVEEASETNNTMYITVRVER